MTIRHNNHETAAKKIIADVGKTVVIGVPLGIGKPIGLLNALYRLADIDPSISLTILTGLTLARPDIKHALEKRLALPISDRMLQNYEDPLYEKARKLQRLPDNINVIEFFLTPGEYQQNSYVQKNYVSSNYSAVARDILCYSLNVYGQQVSPSPVDQGHYSLSCNTDLFHIVAQELREHHPANKKIAIVAEVNLNLPFMPGDDAVVIADEFTDIIDTGQYPALFPISRDELSPQDHLIGLYTSCLVKDGGCLQLGIGKFNAGVTHALTMRHQHQAIYRSLIEQLSIHKKFGEVLSSAGSTEPFDKGLYASTEMLSDDYMHLYKAGILKKRVYDHAGLQRLLNLQKIKESISPETIDVLLAHKIINAELTAADTGFLLHYGIFKPEISYHAGTLVLASGEKIPAELCSSSSKQKIMKTCLGDHLKTGKIIHAGFFLGSTEFYRQLCSLPPAELAQFSMTSIARTNTVYWSYELSLLQRQQARFINSAMMVTLGGAAISDGLENLQEISGVGGQFDFVNMASILPDARSIIACHSVRKTQNGNSTNIVWDYQNLTIPRYLRDIVVTEYGIADCRSKTDAEVIKALLNITDSRFQGELLRKAKHYGKLAGDYEIPKCFQQNLPEIIEPIVGQLQAKGYCKPYPCGSDLTCEEQVIQRGLLYLKNCGKYKLAIVALKSLLFFERDAAFDPYLLRMQLKNPKNLTDYFYKKLLKFSIHSTQHR